MITNYYAKIDSSITVLEITEQQVESINSMFEMLIGEKVLDEVMMNIPTDGAFNGFYKFVSKTFRLKKVKSAAQSFKGLLFDTSEYTREYIIMKFVDLGMAENVEDFYHQVSRYKDNIIYAIIGRVIETFADITEGPLEVAIILSDEHKEKKNMFLNRGIVAVYHPTGDFDIEPVQLEEVKKYTIRKLGLSNFTRRLLEKY